MMRLWRVLALLFLCRCGGALAQTAASTPSAADAVRPAMWRVKGVHNDVYLFGTVHVMKPGVVWETPLVSNALKASAALYVEMTDVDPASLGRMQPVIMQAGLDPDHPLSTKISKDDLAALDTAAKKFGLPGAQVLEPMRPWLVYATLEVLPAMKAGYSESSGIDRTLMAEAKAAGKPVVGLETAESQVKALAGLSEPEQVKLLHQELKDLPGSGAEMNDLVAEWERGDVARLAQREADELKAVSPELYDTLLVKRNTVFTGRIADMLKDPAGNGGFVAIGAAHLAGPDSVVAMLEARGFKVERVE